MTLADEFELFSVIALAPDGTSYAFMSNESVGISIGFPEAEFAISGLSIDGVTFDNTIYDPKDGFVPDYYTGLEVTATNIVPEINTVTIMPTIGVEPSDDLYYSYGGDDSGTPIVLRSCAKAVIEEDAGDTIPSDFSYINIASLPTTSVFGAFAYDVNIASCLKIQVGDSTPFISNFVTGRYNLKNTGATPEQSAINFLFQKIASGIEFNPWGYMESVKSNPMIQYAGLWATNFGEGSLGKNKVVLVALNEFYIRLAVRDYILDVSDSELKEVPFDELQAFINFNLNTGSYTEIKIIDNPSTLTFSRCTQTEIDNLFEGNHQPHVDMFDSIKSLLPNEDSEINSNGLASAIYYAERDVIEFKTKYILEVTERDD